MSAPLLPLNTLREKLTPFLVHPHPCQQISGEHRSYHRIFLVCERQMSPKYNHLKKSESSGEAVELQEGRY